MKKLLTLIVLVGLGVGGYVAYRSATPEKATDVGIRDVAPASLVYYAEARDLAGTLEAVRGTEGFKDLEGSRIVDDLSALPLVRNLLDTLDTLAAQVDYPLTDEANLLKFVGREIGVGISLDAEPGKAAWLAVTRLDVDALAKDMLEGKVDWRDLRTELSRRSEQANFSLLTRDHNGYEVTTARRGENIFYWAQMEDLLAVSDSMSLLEQTIDTRVAGGDGSLARLPAFTAEVTDLPDDAVFTDWVNFDAFQERRDLVKGLLTQWVGEYPVSMVDEILDGVTGSGAVALSVLLPDGDLYRIRRQWSKPAEEIFADKASPDVLGALPADAAVIAEVRDLGRLADAWEGSAVWNRLRNSELFDTVMDGAGSSAPQLFGAGAPTVDRFTVKFGMNLVAQGARSLLAGDFGTAVTRVGPEPGFVVAARLSTEGRFLELALRGAADDGSIPGMIREERDGRVVRGDAEAVWCQVGDLFVLASDPASVWGAVERAEADNHAGSARVAVKSVLDELEEGYAFMFVVDTRHIMDDMGAVLDPASGLEVGQLRRMMNVDTVPRIAFAGYVDDTFSKVEVRWLAEIDPDASGPAADFMQRAITGEPKTLSMAPDNAFLYTGQFLDLDAYYRLMLHQLGADAEGMIGDVETKFRETFELDLVDGLLASLGPEISFALAPNLSPEDQHPEFGAGSAPRVPGLMFAIQVKDEKVVRSVLDQAVRMLGDELSGDGSGIRLTDGRHAGVPFHKLHLSADAQRQAPGVSPAVGFVNGFLVAVSNEDILRRMIDGGNGGASNLKDSAVWARAADAGIPSKGNSLALLDWNGMMDQIGEYADLMGNFVPGGEDVPFPEPPADGNPAEWNRRMENYNRARTAVAAQGGKKVRSVLDSLRVIDFMVATSDVEADRLTGRWIVKFAE